MLPSAWMAGTSRWRRLRSKSRRANILLKVGTGGGKPMPEPRATPKANWVGLTIMDPLTLVDVDAADDDDETWANGFNMLIDVGGRVPLLPSKAALTSP